MSRLAFVLDKILDKVNVARLDDSEKPEFDHEQLNVLHNVCLQAYTAAMNFENRHNDINYRELIDHVHAAFDLYRAGRDRDEHDKLGKECTLVVNTLMDAYDAISF